MTITIKLNLTSPLCGCYVGTFSNFMVTAPVLEYEENINLPKGSKSVKLQEIKN